MGGLASVTLRHLLACLLALSAGAETFAQTAPDSSAMVRITAGKPGAQKQGTGFIVAADPRWVFIVTAAHVVAEADKDDIRVELYPRGGTSVSDIRALVLAEDSATSQDRGLAILRADVNASLRTSLTRLVIADAASLVLTDQVLLEGFPRDTNAFTVLTRRISTREGLYYRIDGSVGEGFSGAPAMKGGLVVGVVTERAQTNSILVTAGMIRMYLDGNGVVLPPTPKVKSNESPAERPNPAKEAPAAAIPNQATPKPSNVAGAQACPDPRWPAQSSVVQPGPKDAKDIWVTSVYSFAPGGGGPGGGLNNEYLRVGGWGDQYYSLLEFNLREQPKHVSSAKLYLCAVADQGSVVSMYVDRITDPWDWNRNDRLWWANRPRFQQWASSPLAPPHPSHWYMIDITDLYNAWQSGQYPNYGLQLRPAAVDNRFNRFLSGDYLLNPLLRPALVLQE